MVKFFIPHAKDAAETESVCESIRAFAIENSGHPVVGRRIYRMTWRHKGHRYESTVGKPDVRLGEEVIAILEGAATYLVCTPNRGVVRGIPMLVGKDEAMIVEDIGEQTE